MRMLEVKCNAWAGLLAGRSLAVSPVMTRLISIASVFVALAAGVPLGHAQPAASAAKPASTAADADRFLAAQVALDRAGFSPGEIDGRRGKNTEAALRAFQKAQGLTETGALDTSTIAKLSAVVENPLATYAITAEDAAGPFVQAIPADMLKKAKLPALGYVSIRELLGERFHVNPALLVRLNPGAPFKQGDVIQVPNVEPYFPSSGTSTTKTPTDAVKARNADAASAAPGGVSRAAGAPSDVVVTVTDASKTLTVEDGSGIVIFQAPVTVGSTNDPLPVGEWKVNGVQRNPSFNYNPNLFWDAKPSDTNAKIAPGPNNPVGTIWIDLSKEHYGIHGTPEPSRIGYTESHGCIRLTNWDVTRLASLVGPGTKVILR
jgi:lipoprotein-anchoring transpeptidase ErfK/SrfK